MILSRTSDDDTLGYAWGMGTAELLLNAGHNEYSIPENDVPSKSIVRQEWSLDPEEEGCPCSPSQLRAIDAEVGPDGWETVVRVQGPVVDIATAFYRLAMNLDPSMDPASYTPCGDDDTFDYWPSGMRLLHQLATDLDNLTSGERGEVGCTCGTPPFAPLEPSDDCPFHGRRAPNPTGERYLERYRQVLGEALDRDVPEMEGLPEYDAVLKLARRWVAR